MAEREQGAGGGDRFNYLTLHSVLVDIILD